jgi:hypothetical protein
MAWLFKGGSAVLSQIHSAFSARWDWTPLCSAPKIVHDWHYPVAPKLVLLQSQDHAAFPKRNHCSGMPSGSPLSPAVISLNDVISLFQADGICPVTVLA